MNDMRDALEAIVIRCKEGDKKFNWLPTITDIAERALASQPSPAATVETVKAGPSNWRELEACPVAPPHLSAGNATALWQARYVLRNLDKERPGCGYGKLADACRDAADALTPTEPQAAPVTDEIKKLRAAVEYWRLAAERRDARRDLTGLDIPEAQTLDAPEPQTAANPTYPTDPADKKLAADWYTWGFQAGMEAERRGAARDAASSTLTRPLSRRGEA